ncbi:MAG: hypothetical protein PHC51_02770 [bacterium]|nr:hypothetical protein [bacterium]
MPFLNVAEGTYVKLTAKTGKSKDSSQAYAKPWPEQDVPRILADANYFLENDGERGPQVSIVKPGNWPINTYLWDVAMDENGRVPNPGKALKVEQGQVAVIKSNYEGPVDFGVVKVTKLEPKSAENRSPLVPVGYQGNWEKALPSALYYFNSDVWQPSVYSFQAQISEFKGGYVPVDIQLSYDDAGKIIQNIVGDDPNEVPALPAGKTGEAIEARVEGWPIHQEVRVVWQVTPEDAPYVAPVLGSLADVETKIITAGARTAIREIGGGAMIKVKVSKNVKGKDEEGKDVIKTEIVEEERPILVMDFIDHREEIQHLIFNKLSTLAAKNRVTILEVHLAQTQLPPELLVGRKREQMAIQLQETFVQEKQAQEKRVDAENARAKADQQGTLMRAQIALEASELEKKAKANEGAGEREKLSEMAVGQQRQVAVLGAEKVMQLRQFEMLVDKVTGLVEKHPDWLNTLFSNEHLVPQISTGGGMDSAAAILGTFFKGFNFGQDGEKPTK